MLFSYGQIGNKKYTASIDRSCAKSLDKTMHNEKFNSWTKIKYWQKMLQGIYGKKKKKAKKGEKKESQESCRWTSLKFYLNF